MALAYEGEAGPTVLVYRCRRRGDLVTEAHPDTAVAVRRAVEAGQLATVYTCEDGADGVAELVGTGPGRRPVATVAEASP